MKRKTLTTALLAGLTGAVGVANISNAVNINPDGLGQTLIYPYYTVRDGNDTLISVVNTTTEAKAVKVRFLEGENSREVLDFNLYLSKFDVWTAAVVDDGEGGRMFTSDLTCTVPVIPAEGVPFRTFAFVGDGGSTTRDRTREGYLEMIEMGVLTNGGGFASDGVPVSCAALNASWNGGTWDSSGGGVGVTAPTGGLFGGASIINVAGGTDAAYNADALDAFVSSQEHTSPGSTLPNLDSADPTSTVFDNGTVVTSTWVTGEGGVDAVSAVYMHDAIMNEYVLEEDTQSGTDWVVTFPTKRFYTNEALPIRPFTTTFDGTACEPIALNIYDREENTTEGELDFSPLPPTGGNVLCWEVTIITFNNSDVFGSELSENINSPFENGWLNLRFTDAGHSMTSDEGDVYNGLPVTGFQVQTFTNGNVGGVLSNYAGLFKHRASRDITQS